MTPQRMMKSARSVPVKGRAVSPVAARKKAQTVEEVIWKLMLCRTVLMQRTRVAPSAARTVALGHRDQGAALSGLVAMLTSMTLLCMNFPPSPRVITPARSMWVRVTSGAPFADKYGTTTMQCHASATPCITLQPLLLCGRMCLHSDPLPQGSSFSTLVPRAVLMCRRARLPDSIASVGG